MVEIMHMQEADRVAVERVCQGHQCSSLHSESQGEQLHFCDRMLWTHTPTAVVNNVVKQKASPVRGSSPAVTVMAAHCNVHEGSSH